MKTKTIIRSMLLALVASAAFAQCPADPSTVLSGRWTFQGGPSGLTGQLIFKTGSRFISAIVTQVQSGNLQTNDNASGSYFLNNTCSGGGIFINLPQGSIQWNFDIATNATFGRVLSFTAIPISTTPGAFAGPTSVGTAWPAPAGCPVSVTNPINLLSGTYSTVSLSNVTVSGGAGSSLRGSMDILAPTTFLGDSRGNLLARLTPFYPTAPPIPVNNVPTQLLPVTSLTGDSGTYSVQSDCQRVSLVIDYAWPRPVVYVGYPRVRTAGAIELVVVGSNAVGDPLTSTGSIAR